MKLWTLQSKEVMQIIDDEGIYRPDFKKSRFPSSSRDMYYEVLESFNRINETQLNGVVFCFGQYCAPNTMTELNSKEVFDRMIANSGIKGMLSSGYYNLFDGTHSLLRVEGFDSVNPIIVNYADFCDLKSPQFFLSPDQAQQVHDSIRHGIVVRPIIQCGSFFQYHIPFLKKERIVERYDNYSV